MCTHCYIVYNCCLPAVATTNCSNEMYRGCFMHQNNKCQPHDLYRRLNTCGQIRCIFHKEIIDSLYKKPSTWLEMGMVLNHLVR